MLKIVDVSSAQGVIDTSILDCDLVFVKVSEGTKYINEWCNSQVAGVLQAKKGLGLYHYASVGDPIEQARYFYENAKNYFTENRALPILDYEEKAANQGVNWALRFLEEIEQLTGFSPILYLGKEVANMYDWTPVSQRYALWGAEYMNMLPTYGFNFCPWDSNKPWGSWGEPSFFQYTANGHLDGYDGDLDLSIGYLDMEAFNKFTNGENQTNVPTPVIPEPSKNEAGINGIYFVDQVVNFDDKWYVVNNDISVKPIDYNNYIPVETIVMVDEFGNKLDDQNTVKEGMFFTFGEPDQNTYYEIRYLSDKFISTTMNGEPVWFDKQALGDSLILK